MVNEPLKRSNFWVGGLRWGRRLACRNQRTTSAPPPPSLQDKVKHSNGQKVETSLG